MQDKRTLRIIPTQAVNTLKNYIKVWGQVHQQTTYYDTASLQIPTNKLSLPMMHTPMYCIVLARPIGGEIFETNKVNYCSLINFANWKVEKNGWDDFSRECQNSLRMVKVEVDQSTKLTVHGAQWLHTRFILSGPFFKCFVTRHQ